MLKSSKPYDAESTTAMLESSKPYDAQSTTSLLKTSKPFDASTAVSNQPLTDVSKTTAHQGITNAEFTTVNSDIETSIGVDVSTKGHVPTRSFPLFTEEEDKTTTSIYRMQTKVAHSIKVIRPNTMLSISSTIKTDIKTKTPVAEEELFYYDDVTTQPTIKYSTKEQISSLNTSTSLPSSTADDYITVPSISKTHNTKVKTD